MSGGQNTHHDLYEQNALFFGKICQIAILGRPFGAHSAYTFRTEELASFQANKLTQQAAAQCWAVFVLYYGVV